MPAGFVPVRVETYIDISHAHDTISSPDTVSYHDAIPSSDAISHHDAISYHDAIPHDDGRRTRRRRSRTSTGKTAKRIQMSIVL